MQVSQLKNAVEFMDIVGEMLYANETTNNLILGVSERLVRDPKAYQNPFYAVVRAEDGALLLAALMTPPHNLILAGDEGYLAGAAALVAYIRDHPLDIPGVIGPAHFASHFSKVWQKEMGQTSQLHMCQKVYELRTVQMPTMPSGHFRIANTGDVSQVAEWLKAFEIEAMGKPSVLDQERAIRLIKNGEIYVWECSGEAVSMAMKTRPVTHSITISGVYTPPEHRRKGYATALVAKLSQRLLGLGYQFVNLFTDLSNPTSNSIYRKIGYNPVCDFRMYAFGGAEG